MDASPGHLTTARTEAVVRGLSLTPVDAASDDIGTTGLVGNATTDITQCCDSTIVTFRVMSLDALHPFAKAGLMARDSLDANAAHVILDVRPGGDVEFMARQCTGCATTFLSTAHVGFPALFRITRHGNT